MTRFQHTVMLIPGLAVLALLPVTGCETAPYLRQRGIEAYDDARYERAEQLFGKSVDIDPGAWKGHMYLGLANLQRDQFIEAQHELELALTMNPDTDRSPEILDALAAAIYGQGNAAALHALLDQACSNYGTTHDYLRQARFLIQLGDLDNARIALGKAASFAAPSDPEAQLAIADFYESVGNTEKVIHALRRALYIDPDNQHIQQRLRGYGVIPGPTAALAPTP